MVCMLAMMAGMVFRTPAVAQVGKVPGPGRLGM